MSFCPWRIEAAQRLGRLAPERCHELAVVGVGDLAGAVVELELLQRRERSVALLREARPLALSWRELGEPVVLGRRLAEEGSRDEPDADDSQQYRKDEGGSIHR